MSRRVNIGSDGGEIALRNGSFAVVSEYGPNYQIVRELLVGPDGNRFNGADGIPYFIREYNRWGNDIATSYYRLDGKPAVRSGGYSKVTPNTTSTATMSGAHFSRNATMVWRSQAGWLTPRH